MKRYVVQYRNQKWLCTVFGAVEGSDYILLAVVPGVAWFDIGMQLRDDEVETLRRSEDQFTEIVKQFVRERNSAKFSHRRIESRIQYAEVDEIVLADDT